MTRDDVDVISLTHGAIGGHVILFVALFLEANVPHALIVAIAVTIGAAHVTRLTLTKLYGVTPRDAASRQPRS